MLQDPVVAAALEDLEMTITFTNGEMVDQVTKDR